MRHPPAPRDRLFGPPILVTAGQKIAYECTHDNATQPRLGCGEQPRVSPGRSIIDALRENAPRNPRPPPPQQPGAPPGRSILDALAETGLDNPGRPAKLCTVVGSNPSECPPTDDAFPGRTF